MRSTSSTFRLICSPKSRRCSRFGRPFRIHRSRGLLMVTSVRNARCSFEVLLDVGVFVIDVEARLHALELMRCVYGTEQQRSARHLHRPVPRIVGRAREGELAQIRIESRYIRSRRVAGKRGMAQLPRGDHQDHQIVA